MKQRESYKNAMKKQEEYIQEMENYISLPEEENNLQKQFGDYTKAVHQMMDDLHL